MKYVFRYISEIERNLIKAGVVLLLDFDLTLSPLAKDPTKAFLPGSTKELLKKLTKRIPVVIVSGRKLSDVRKRVGIRDILYIGNHGFEYNITGKYKTFNILTSAKRALSKVKKEFIQIKLKYPGAVFEDKKYSIALGYRMIRLDKLRSLESRFQEILEKIKKEGLLEVRLDKKTFEVRPRTEMNKGVACLLALSILKKKFRKKMIPIYVGDSETDEDVFKVFRSKGITIRVNKNQTSHAGWYLQNQKETNYFLEWLLCAIKVPQP